MAIKVGINGFGRIGRNVLRSAVLNFGNDIEIVAINDLLEPDYLAYMLKYDSVHGRFKADVAVSGGDLLVNGKKIRLTQERDPSNLKWDEVGVDVVIESTGLFLTKDTAQKHIDAGAKKVIMSAPSKDDTPMFVFGVNDKTYAGQAIVSNASCTTNCLAPVAKVLNDSIGIERGLMTTVHAYTNDQKILDQIHPDLRRARAAAMSMIPTTTGAARAVGEVLPELKGKLDGSAIRVPTPDGSLVDLTFTPKRDTTIEEVNALLKAAAEGPMEGVLHYSDEPLVSIDIVHTPYSSTVDSLETAVIDGKLVRVVSWYDNEWGFSNRMVDTATLMAKLG